MLDDAEGVVMLIDTDHKPTGGFYVMDTWNGNTITSRFSSNGPLLLRAGRDAFMPMSYDSEKIIIQLHTIRHYQSVPRYDWDRLIRMGYANSRFEGASFRGMVKNDVLRFEQSMNSTTLDSEHPGKSIFSDSDYDDRECNFPTWGRGDATESECSTKSLHEESLEDPLLKAIMNANKRKAALTVESMRKVQPNGNNLIYLFPQIDRDNIYRCLQNLGTNQEHLISLRKEIKDEEVYDSNATTELIDGSTTSEAEDQDPVVRDEKERNTLTTFITSESHVTNDGSDAGSVFKSYKLGARSYASRICYNQDEFTQDDQFDNANIAINDQNPKDNDSKSWDLTVDARHIFQCDHITWIRDEANAKLKPGLFAIQSKCTDMNLRIITQP